MHIFARHTSPLPAQLPSHLRHLFNQMLNHQESDDSAVVTANWVPHMDIREESDRLVIHADLPGIDPTQIEVQMDGDTLSIKGERTVESKDEGEQDGARFSRIERQTGSFHRRFVLPDTVDAERITASGQNGVLEISIPKRPETTPKRIEVTAQAA